MKKNKSLGPSDDVLETFKKLEVKESECKGNMTKMIKRFSKKVRKSERIKEVFNRMHYVSKSEKNRRARLKAKRINRLEQLNDEKF